MSMPLLLYGLLLITPILLFFLVALVISYYRLLGKHDLTEGKREVIEAKARREADRLFADAEKNAHKIVEESRLKAQEIISGAGVFSDDVKNKLFEELRTVSVDQAQNYKKMLEVSRGESLNLINEISKQMKEEALKEVEKFRSSLQQDLLSSQQVTKAAMDDIYRKVEGEVKTYREEKLRQVDNRIFEILKKISKEVLGKALILEEHEELVIKALEDAKKQNLL